MSSSRLVLRLRLFRGISSTRAQLLAAPILQRRHGYNSDESPMNIYSNRLHRFTNINNNSTFQFQGNAYYATQPDSEKSGSVTSADGTMSDRWAEHEFLRIADASLEHVSEIVGALGFENEDDDENNNLDDFDVDLSQGVLTIKLGSAGTYVLNTQTPNRQIWLSSPVSGPWRYAWHPETTEWISTRDGHTLSGLLNEELGEVFRRRNGIGIEFN